ncbi:prolipoprotein diacylglyceryl transferase [Paracnuella aquatica]|uniref:prolipoprotein diacylglyceryl transferase n=1 Tax=Paracnuella aquatica TaxID=2268757 RepID=UPI000DEF95A1|nr:prolipoprotein diacylglyceryl transferase family protein [Paracnuella aquatica]RPD48256.1 diacylglyceryl transferase [Paracnuella aquatica]
MQFPLTIPIGGMQLPLHAVLEAAAFFTGFRYYLHLRRKQGDVFSSESRMFIIIGAIFGALLGSRIVGALEQPELWWQSANPLLYLYANKTVLGGFLGGIAGVELAKKRMGERRASGDLFVFPMILALCIGRLGCFSMGVYEETYGLPTQMPTGMNLGDGQLRHPVALYEILFLLLLWVLLRNVQQTTLLANGALFKLFMVLYLVFRFQLDFIKPHYSYPIGLSAIQICSLLGLLYYAPFIVQPKKLLQPRYART